MVDGNAVDVAITISKEEKIAIDAKSLIQNKMPLESQSTCSLMMKKEPS